MKFLADPLAWAWATLIANAAVCFWRRRCRKGWVLLGVAVAMSTAHACGIHERLMAGLERPFLNDSRHPIEPADAVVVLGGYLDYFPGAYLGIEFSEAADRLFTGIALVRDDKAPVLVLGGPGVGSPPVLVEAETAKKFIESWRLLSTPIKFLGANKDTHDEAVHCAKLARESGWKRVILVTSAAHLRRASGAFRKAGLDITPVGCDFRATEVFRGNWHIRIVPRTASFAMLDQWIEEEMGYAYYRLRGWL